MIAEYLGDCLRAIAAFVLLTPLLIFPGYAVAELTGIFNFRSQSFLPRLCLSMGVSVAIVPILLFYLWSVSIHWVVVGYCLSAAMGFALLLKNRRRFRQARIPRTVVLIGVAWTLIVLFSLIDLPIGNGIYVTGVADPDHSYRVEIVAHLAHAPQLPPTFPFLAGDLGKAVLRYHYFWFMVCGVIPDVTGWRIGARDALIASVVWIGLLLLAMIGLFWKFVFKVPDPLRKSLASIPVLLSGGLQAPLFLLMQLVHRGRRGNWTLTRSSLSMIDGLGQITSWWDSLFWVPNHVAAAVASLATLLALYATHKTSDWRQRAVLVALAGLSLASTVGLSVFVGMPFFAYLGILAAYLLWKAPRSRTWAEIAAALVLAIALIFPYLLSIRAPAGTPSPIALSIRPSSLAQSIARHTPQISEPGRQLLNLAAEPVVFFEELGIMAVIAIWALASRKDLRTELERERDRLIGLFAWVTIAIVLLVNSREISGGTNDLGWRVPLGALFFLSFYAVRFFDQWRSTGTPPLRCFSAQQMRPLLTCLVIFGFATTVGEFLLLRFYFVTTQTNDAALSTADLRSGLTFLRANTPPEAVVQLNPATDDATSSGLFLERRTALRAGSNIFYTYNSFSPDLIQQKEKAIRPIYSDSALGFNQIQQTCSTLGIDYLVVRPDDSVFNDRRSWTSQASPVFQNRSVRIYRCRFTNVDR